MHKSVSRVLTLSGRNIKEILRDPLSLVFMLVLPLTMEVSFYYIFHNMTSQFEMKYLVPGIVVFSQSFLSLFSGILIALDRSSAFLTRLFVSPVKPHEFILGYAISLMPIAFTQSVLFFIIGGIIDSSIFGIGMVYGILLSIIASLLYIGLGIMFGSMCNEKSVGGVASIVIMCQSVLSGMWFPRDGLGKGVIIVMDCLPFKNATDMIQNALTGENNIYKPMLIVLVYAIAAFAAAIVFLKNKMISK